MKGTSSQRINDIISIFKDQKSTAKVEFCESVDYVMYHRTCFTSSNSKKKSAQKGTDIEQMDEWQQIRTLHSKVFPQFQQYLTERIIHKREVLALTDVYNYYIRNLNDESSSSHAEPIQTSFQPQHLLDKIFRNRADITKISYKHRIFLHAGDMQFEEVLSKGFEKEDVLSSNIKSVAMEIRKKIHQIELRKLPKNNITVKNITEGECDIPDDLYLLIESIVHGPSWQNQNSSTRKIIKQNKISAICDNIIFATSNGTIKPSTCLTLALATKSLTGSRRMLNILNRLGHCVSYSVAEGIETELAYACSIEHRVLPYDLNPKIQTHVAFDNYDQYVETSTGKDTLHDTVGIAIQNKCQRLTMNSLQESTEEIGNIHTDPTLNLVPHDINTTQSRRRKYFSPFENSIEPYMKGNQTIACLIGNSPIIPNTLKVAVDMKNLWTFNQALMRTYAKKWFAWYSERVIDPNPVQKIGYLPIINESPTSDSVVLKTLNMALDLANECEQKYIVVTYDLAIAMKANRILADMKNKFERIFVNLGSFHIELAYFKVNIHI